MSTVSFGVIYVLFRGWKLERWPTEEKNGSKKLQKKQLMTLLGLAAFVGLAMIAGLEMGLSAFLVAAALLLLGCADEKKVIAEVPWSSILMICGMCILIGVVRIAGGIDLLTELLGKLMNRYTVKPIYSIIGSLLAMVSSISGVVLPGMIPTIPAIAVQTSVNPFAIVTALAYGANITCVSPVSSMGAIALGIMGANREWDSNRLFKRMFAYAFILMGVAAVLAAIGIA